MTWIFKEDAADASDRLVEEVEPRMRRAANNKKNGEGSDNRHSKQRGEFLFDSVQGMIETNG